ncbi:MAG: DUF916 and DUF3324 domain-containing protein [Bifidobacteriaceae bacterium]|nr:DUF916 and DUF3324 domain-containing protein [Bifidobacteriaceae bacterium]MCI1914449.1 DUF916 and DUF3324 domain-containing protein [Bifidobacteriaceae bacterium]
MTNGIGRASAIVASCVAALLVAGALCVPAHAAGFGLSVNPVLPQEQRSTTTSYFDVAAAPGRVSTLKVDLVNKTSKAMKVSAAVVPASTSDSGSVAYDATSAATTSVASTAHKLPDLVSVKNQTLQIPANSTRIFTTKLTMPAQSFEGVVAGGIVVEQLGQNAEKTSHNGGVGIGISSKYRYVIAVLARNSEKTVTSDLSFGKASARQVSKKNQIALKLENARPTFLNQLEVSATATLASDSSKSYKQSASGMQMAPNSSFSYAISLPDDVSPGTYDVSAAAYYVQDSKGPYTGADAQKYKYRKTFKGKVTVSAATAKKFSDSISSVRDAPGIAWWVYVIVIVVLLLLILLVLAYVVYRRKQLEMKRLRTQLANAQGEVAPRIIARTGRGGAHRV